MENTGYWISYCNPSYFDIEEFLSIGEINTTWTIMDWQKDLFQIGQLGIIRVGNDNRSLKQRNGKDKLERGIYATFKIISTADFFPDSDLNLWLNPEKRDQKRLRVKIRITKNLLYSPILIDNLKTIKETKNDEPLIKARQASSWSLTENAFRKIAQLAEIEFNKTENIKEESILNLDDIKKLEEKYRNATPKIKEIISKRIERGEISKEIKKINNFNCQICGGLGNKTDTFKKINGEYYIETHHIIPVSELSQGLLGISNLMTVCANHHRQLHYGDVKIINETEIAFIFQIDGRKITIEKTKIPVANNS